MPKRKDFLLRIDPEVFRALEVWARDDLRSVNGQIEFLLRKALLDSGRSGRQRQAERASGEDGS